MLPCLFLLQCSLPLDSHLTGSSLIFRFQLKCYQDRNTLEGPYVMPWPCLIFFLAPMLFYLFTYLCHYYSVCFIKAVFWSCSVVSGIVPIWIRHSYLLIEWRNDWQLFFVCLPFVLCLVFLGIIVSPDACGMVVLSFTCPCVSPLPQENKKRNKMSD